MKRVIALLALAVSLALVAAGCATYVSGEYCKELDNYDLKLSVGRDQSVLSVQFPDNYCVVKWESGGNEYAALLPCDKQGDCTVVASLRRQSNTFWGADVSDANSDVVFYVDTSPPAIVRVKGVEGLALDSNSEADSNAWLDLVWNLKSDDGLVLDDHAEFEFRDGICIVTGDLPLEIADPPEKTELKYTIKSGAVVGAFTPQETGNSGEDADDTIKAGLVFPKDEWVEIDRVPTIQHKDSIRVQYSKRDPQPVNSVLVLGIDEEDAHFEVKNGGEYLHGSLSDSFWEKIRE